MTTTGDPQPLGSADAPAAEQLGPARAITDRLVRGSGTRRCALCGQPIRGGQRVDRVHGTAVHARCARMSSAANED